MTGSTLKKSMPAIYNVTRTDKTSAKQKKVGEDLSTTVIYAHKK